ncbi:MAG: PAS domain S-box protein, partial [Woeseia sp.]
EAGIGEALHVLDALRQIGSGDRRLRVSLNYPYATPDGVRWFNVHVSAFGAGSDIHAVIAYRDITGEREAQKGLQALNESLELRIEERTADLRLANKTLQVSEERFRSLFAGASVASIILDTDANLIEVNPAFSAMTGVSEKTATGQAFEQLVDPADWPDIAKMLDRICTGQLPGCELDFRCKTPEGSEWVLASLSAVKRADNNVSQIVGLLQSRNAQREAEYQRDNFFNLSIDMLLVTHTDGRIVRANPACEKILGYTPEQMQKMSLSDLVAPEEREAGENARAAMESGESLVLFDLRCVAANGAIRDIRWNATPWVEEGLVLSVGRDVTQIRAAERNLILHDKMRTRAEEMASMGSWNWQIGDDGLVVSRGLRRIAGIDLAEPVHGLNDLLRFIEKKDRNIAETTIRAVAADGASRIIRCHIRRVDHTVRTVQMYNDVVRDSNGDPVAVSGACLDVTELHETLDRARRSKTMLRTLTMRLEDIRDDERATISREIHDELGQMLTALKIDIALLERDTVNDRKPLPSRQGLSGSLKSLEQLTDKTIDSVRRIARQLRPDGLDELGLLPALEWHIEEFQKRTGIRCSFDCPPQPLEINLKTRSALYRIAQEAMTNTARHAGADRIDIQLRASAQQVELSIGDNGCGMDAEVVDGTRSIGILGMRERATMAGGSFEIGNNGECGTRVLVRLPLTGRPPTARNQP